MLKTEGCPIPPSSPPRLTLAGKLWSPKCRPASPPTLALVFWVPTLSLEQLYLAASVLCVKFLKRVRGRDLLLCFWLPRAPTPSAPPRGRVSSPILYPSPSPRLKLICEPRPPDNGLLWPWADPVLPTYLGFSREPSPLCGDPVSQQPPSPTR